MVEHRPQRAACRRMPTARDITTAIVHRAARAGAAAAACACASGAELVVADIRIGLHALPTDFDYTVTDEGRQSDGSTSFESGFGIGGRAIHAFSSPGSAGAWLIGGELFGGWYNYDSSGTFRSLSVRALTGYAYAWNEKLTFEITPFIGYGLASFDLPGEGLYADVSVSGHEIEYGAMIGASYAFSQHWLGVAEVGWMTTNASLQGDGLTIDMTQSGPAFFLGAVWR